MLIFSSKELYKNYKPFVLGLLRREDVVPRLLRVCAREVHRRREVDRSPTYCFDVTMDMEFEASTRSERFLTFNFGSTINFNMQVAKRARHFRGFVPGQDLTDYFQFTINSGVNCPYIELGLWDCRHLRRNIRMVGFESDADLPQYEGEGEDFTFRTLAGLGLRAGERALVLTLNQREWISRVVVFPNGEKTYRDFRFLQNPNGEAHALLLASDLIQNAAGFAPHAALGIASS
jgi:hypothetical protein